MPYWHHSISRALHRLDAALQRRKPCIICWCTSSVHASARGQCSAALHPGCGSFQVHRSRALRHNWGWGAQAKLGKVGDIGFKQAMQAKWVALDKSGGAPVIKRKVSGPNKACEGCATHAWRL